MDNKKLPDLTVVKGVLAVALGIILIWRAYDIILNAILFVAGVFFVYYGLAMLNIPSVNHFFASVRNHFNKFIS